MKFRWLISIAALLAFTAASQAESVYKLKDSSGATVYSDRPNLPGTTKEGTVKVGPGPSAEQQQAAEQNVQQMENKSDEMRRSRMEREQKSARGQDRNTTAVDEIDATGVGVVDGRRRDPKARIPVESRDGGEHAIYEPGKGPPVHIAPHPSPRAGRR